MFTFIIYFNYKLLKLLIYLFTLKNLLSVDERYHETVLYMPLAISSDMLGRLSMTFYWN
jgi:hypothetical protein